MEEDKKLLSVDLSARLPFNIKCQFTLKYGDNGHKEGTYLATITTFDGKDWLEIEYNDTNGASGKPWLRDWSCSLDDIKPYLRPISSMTMEEDRKRIDLGIWKSNQYNGQVIGIFQDIAYANPRNFQSALIWLLQNHFDIFGLIPKGLAIEVTEENNPYK